LGGPLSALMMMMFPFLPLTPRKVIWLGQQSSRHHSQLPRTQFVDQKQPLGIVRVDVSRGAQAYAVQDQKVFLIEGYGVGMHLAETLGRGRAWYGRRLDWYEC
jgi:hypothetical protein